MKPKVLLVCTCTGAPHRDAMDTEPVSLMLVKHYVNPFNLNRLLSSR